MEQMEYNLLFRWFGGPGIDDPVWGEVRPEISPVGGIQHRAGGAPRHGPTVVTKKRDRLLTTEMSRKWRPFLPTER